jgi:hypothetical protein
MPALSAEIPESKHRIFDEWWWGAVIAEFKESLRNSRSWEGE